MIPNSLEQLNSDTYDLIFQFICNSSDYDHNSDFSALLPLSLVCKLLRSETLRWIFREFHWKLHLQKDFLPHNLRTYIRTLRITTNDPVNHLAFDRKELQTAFSALKNTRKLIVSGEGGASQCLLSLLTLMPALGIVEWNDVPFTDVSCDFSKMAGIFHLTYSESRLPSPRTLELENQLISTTISSSAHTLLHLTMPGRRASQTVLSDCFFPALKTLILTGFAPRTHESPLYQLLPKMPNLQNLQTRLCLGPPFEIYPHTENDTVSNNSTKTDPPMLHSLTMYNIVPTDQILRNLPSTLQYLSLAQHPYPYEIIKEHGHKLPRLILNSTVSYLNRPKLTTTDILQHLEYCNLNALRELRLAVSGILSTSWFLDLSRALPELETLELHYWHPRAEEAIPSIDHYAPAFAAFTKLRDLRLDLHLTDEVDHCADESCKAETQLSRAKTIALHAAPSLKAIGFLEGHARIMAGGTANPTIFWRIFNIVRKHNSISVGGGGESVELLVRQYGDFRLYRNEEY